MMSGRFGSIRKLNNGGRQKVVEDLRTFVQVLQVNKKKFNLIIWGRTRGDCLWIHN